MGNWLKRIGIASFFAFPIAVILYRLNITSFGSSFMILRIGAVIGALVFLLGVGFFIFSKNKNPEGAKAAIVGAIIAVIPLVPLAMQAKKAKTVPFIHNVSTDIEDAPVFDKVLSLRDANDNPHHYDPTLAIGESGTLGELQAGAYPDVKTLISTLSVADAVNRAESTAKAMGWELVNVDVDRGIVEATETTLLWGFKDDIVIRIKDQGGTTEVDLKSVSRFGGSDLGANAARIIAFLDNFKDKD